MERAEGVGVWVWKVLGGWDPRYGSSVGRDKAAASEGMGPLRSSTSPPPHPLSRLHDVDIYHSKTRLTMTSHGPSTDAYVRDAVNLVLKLHQSQVSLTPSPSTI